MDFNGLISGIKNAIFPQKQKIISPLPDGYNPQNQDAYSTIEKYRPEYKGSYAQTNGILQKHKLEDLIPEIRGGAETAYSRSKCRESHKTSTKHCS